MKFTSSVSVNLHYDWYEYKFGDGFYPLTANNDANNLHNIDIIFDLTNGIWCQRDKMPIRGLDGNQGDQLLLLLNHNITENPQPCIIMNNEYKQIYPKNK